MTDPVFFNFHERLSAEFVFERLKHADLISPDIDFSKFPIEYRAIQTLSQAGQEDISFFHNAKYASDLSESKAGLIFVPKGLLERFCQNKPCLEVNDVHRAIALIGNAFLNDDQASSIWHPTAIVAEDAVVGTGVSLGPYVVIGSGAKVGSGSRIAAHVHLDSNIVLGENCRIDSGVKISHAIVGDRVHIKPGACIGQRGFGWALSPNGHEPKPQLGRVFVGSDVEIGANTAIDRGSLEDTVIGQGTVIDNLCHIAHNCHLGRYCAVAANTAFAGTTILGDFVQIGGAVASKGHVRVGDGAKVRIDSFIGTNIGDGADVAGRPARAISAYRRLLRHWSRAGRGAKG